MARPDESRACQWTGQCGSKRCDACWRKCASPPAPGSDKGARKGGGEGPDRSPGCVFATGPRKNTYRA
eukprot:6374620-Pyramimonas_sp.AAC.1